ncbi:MAG: SIMPL domain-containing protein [Thermomicrobiales bacterium]
MTEERRTITVSGRGRVETPPDLGHISLGVRVTNRDPESGLNISNNRITDIRDALLDAGVAADDVALGWFSITTVYDHVDGRRTFRGYQISHDLSITVREIERTGALLSIAVQAGADDVRGVSFTVEDPSKSIDLARERAFENARHKARELARMAGLELGTVVSMIERTFEPVPAGRYEMHAMSAPAPASRKLSEVPIDADDADFSVSMEVVWEIGQ